VEVPPEHRRFAAEVAAAKAQDPLPTLPNLSTATGIPVDGITDWLAAGR